MPDKRPEHIFVNPWEHILGPNLSLGQILDWLYGELVTEVMTHKLDGTLEEWARKHLTKTEFDGPPWSLIDEVSIFRLEGEDAWEVPDFLSDDFHSGDIDYDFPPIAVFLGQIHGDHHDNLRDKSLQDAGDEYIKEQLGYELDCDLLAIEYDPYSTNSDLVELTGIEWNVCNSTGRCQTLSGLSDISSLYELMTDDHGHDEDQLLRMDYARLDRNFCLHMRQIHISKIWRMFTHLTPHLIPGWCTGEPQPLPRNLTFPIILDAKQLEELPKCHQVAYKEYLAALKSNPSLEGKKPGEVYDWLDENNVKKGKSGKPVKKPKTSRDTWVSYVNKAKQGIGV